MTWIDKEAPYSFQPPIHVKMSYIQPKTKLRGRSPQANYTDRQTAACRRVEGIAWLAQRIPTAINLGLLDRSQYIRP
jgi:hypothetical protein